MENCRTHSSEFSKEELEELKEQARAISWDRYVELEYGMFIVSAEREHPIYCAVDEPWIPDYTENSRFKCFRYGPLFVSVYYEGFGKPWDEITIQCGEYSIKIGDTVQGLEVSDQQVMRWIDLNVDAVIDFAGSAIGKTTKLSTLARETILENIVCEIDERYESEVRRGR